MPRTGYELMLRIVHVSDPHFEEPGSIPWEDRVRILEWIELLFGRHARRSAEAGMATHDETAERRFEKFLAALAAKETQIPTWFVDTGDLTGFGDDASLVYGTSFFGRCRNAYPGLFQQELRLYGNHDAWPGVFPLLGAAAITRHRQRLRRRFFPDRLPAVPIRHVSPDGTVEVALFGLNSVLHEHWRNAKALGEIEEDQYTGPGPIANVQLNELEQRVLSTLAQPIRPHQLRIVATHHPVEYPNPRSRHFMVMENDAHVLRRLTQPLIAPAPLGHLILSGHTHSLSPTALPSTGQPSVPLQLVVGSLMQRQPDPDAAVAGSAAASLYQHQSQVLRVWWARANPWEICVEREFFTREDDEGAGDYVAVAKDETYITV